MTTQILLKFFQSLDGSLIDTKFMAMAPFAYAGFLRFDELSNLRLKDVIPHPTSLKAARLISIVRVLYQLSKPVLTSVPGLTLSNICLKLSSFSLHLLMVAMTSCLGVYRLNPEPNLSVPDPRFHENLSKKLVDLGLNRASFSWRSFRRGGASSATNGGISDRMFKRHGRWRSEKAKDGYVADSLGSRLAVSISLGL